MSSVNFSHIKLSSVEYIQDVLITIHMNIRELQERKNLTEPGELAHIEAKLITYHEVLSILSDSANEFEIPKEEISL